MIPFEGVILTIVDAILDGLRIMKLNDVLEVAKVGEWFRPTWYDGSGMAFTVKGDYLCSVPTSRGAQVAVICTEALKSDWVIISPETVIAESEKWKNG